MQEKKILNRNVMKLCKYPGDLECVIVGKHLPRYVVRFLKLAVVAAAVVS